MTDHKFGVWYPIEKVAVESNLGYQFLFTDGKKFGVGEIYNFGWHNANPFDVLLNVEEDKEFIPTHGTPLPPKPGSEE